MKKLLLLFMVTFLCSAFCSGQQLKKRVLASAGNTQYVHANLKSYYFLQTIGQNNVIATYSANGHMLRQGFLQPVSSTFLSTTTDQTLEAKLFPNPTRSILQIHFSEPVYDLIHIRVFDTHGRELLHKSHLPEEKIQLDLSGIPAGFYMINLRMRAQEFISTLVKR